jgi:predicted transcriptional regulator
MPRRENQVITYLTDDEYVDLEELADETGDSTSYHVRQAILEYLDYDRWDRVEGRLDRIESQLEDVAGALSDGDTHTHKQTQASETVERTLAIAERIDSNHGPVLDASVVDRAIKDIAGADKRTISKYRDELRERNHLYQHPNDDLERWYTDREEWSSDLGDYVRQFTNPVAKLQTIVDNYNLDISDISDNPVIQEVVGDD